MESLKNSKIIGNVITIPYTHISKKRNNEFKHNYITSTEGNTETLTYSNKKWEIKIDNNINKSDYDKSTGFITLIKSDLLNITE